MKRKHLHLGSHPFDRYPFETFLRDSWRPVDRLRINGGVIISHVEENGEMIREDIPMSNLRLKSRKATESDCICFLRPGVDICVYTTSPPTENSDEEEKSEELVWIDAKIRSIERKPHELECGCEFYVSFYITQGPGIMTEKKLSKEVNIVSIHQISILQKLEQKPTEDEYYRWTFSEDCESLQKLKLFIGRFSSDLSWLLVASVLKQTAFDVRSINNKIVYEILDNAEETNRLDSENHSYSVNFKLDDDISAPIIVQFSPSITEARPSGDTDTIELGPLTIYKPMELRRSKRRYVQPERYLGCHDSMDYDIDVDTLRFVSKTYLRDQEDDDDDDIPLALSIQALNHAKKQGEEIGNSVRSYKKKLFQSFRGFNSDVKGIESKNEGKDSSSHHKRDHKSHLSVVPVCRTCESNSKAWEQDPADLKIPEDHSGDIGDVFTRYMHLNGCPTVSKRKSYASRFSESYGQRWSRGPHKVRYKRRSKYTFPLRESIFDVRSSKKGSVSANVCRELIKRCMENIDDTLNKEQPPIIDQWEEFKARRSSNQKECNAKASIEDDEEVSEVDMLWKEMELALASCYLLDDNEENHAESHTGVKGGKYCQHDYRLNEEIGIVCRLCGYVIIEIKNVSPTFLPTKKWTPSKEQKKEEGGPEQKLYEEAGDDDLKLPASSNTQSSQVEVEDNVWALIPDLRNKLRDHQKKAFEFLWRNVAGSLVPAEMEEGSEKRGGCVISHSPGAGKTLLIITFLVSYLKLFPGSRPLVLAPKTTLYTWYKEIIKWNIPVPVYQIHGGQTYKGEILRQKMRLNPGLPRNQDVMHVLDCLEKMQKWLSHPSVLLMGYTSFLTLMRDDSVYAHRKYMAQVLKQCPGILILDEGHNPRSTKSRLRKGLMKVDTKLRVLLSGTLFQNNFGEYFNTLCLARPNFVNEVLDELDPKYIKKKEKSGFSLENRARKNFVDKISRKINSNVPDERIEGLNVLKKLTGGFIDIYEGSNSDILPGLQCYTLMMKPTTLQQGILLKLQNQRPVYKGFPLELELLITLAAIHPWLIRTTACSGQYFSAEELDSLEQYKFDLKLGSKVRFVMSLVPRCLMRKEKVLLFCHNIAPINLFLEIFERFYGWRKGEEVLVLSGEIELFERGRLIDKFEDPSGPSKVMLASITACAEGISLTAASRVILLDSEWNPSKSKQAIARAFRPGQEKVVYVYQLLATGTLEEEKYTRTTWKEYVSCMIFSEELVEDPSKWQAPQIEDELLREIVEEDRAVLFHRIMKNVKASNVIRGKNNVSYDNKEE